MSWTPTETVTEFADYLRVMVGGFNATFWRAGTVILDEESGLAVIPQDWQSTDPYGPMNASLTLPITEFEDVDNDFTWLYEGAKVRFDFVKDGAVIAPNDPEFYGIVDRIIPGPTSTRVECSGNTNGRLSSRMHQPPIQLRPAKYAGWWLDREINGLTVHSGPVRMLPRDGLAEGPKVQARGSRDMTRLGYCDHVLGMAITEDGASQTLLPHPTKGPKYLKHQWRPDVATADVDFTVYAGAHGVRVEMNRDRVDMLTGIFGEGVAPNGERWRNAVYPRLIDAETPEFPGVMSFGTTDADTTTGSGISVLARRLWALSLLTAEDQESNVFDEEIEDAVKDFQRRVKVAVTGVVNESLWGKLFDDGVTGRSFRQAHYEELAADTRTQYWLRGADGTPIGLNPDYDRKVVPNEGFESFGENVKKRHARRNARGQIARGGDLVGTITLTSDPAEMSRFKIRPGMVGLVKHYRGGDTRVYVSSTQVRWGARAVTLAVSETAKHFLELATIKQRRMEARQDPGKRWRHQLRRSAQVSDAISGWEGESGAGIVDNEPLTGGSWTVFPMVAAQLGVIGDWRLETTPATRFIFALFADRVHEKVLNGRLGSPFRWIGDPKPTLSKGATSGSGGSFEAGTYYWVVSAVTADGESDVSNEVSATVGAEGQQVLSWTAVTGATEYRVYRGTASGKQNRLMETVTSGTSYTDSGLAGSETSLPLAGGDNRRTVFEENLDWLLANERLMIEAWGGPENPCGYAPHRHTNDAGKTTKFPVSGKFRDAGQWDFWTKRGFLWMAVWAPDDCTIKGRARIQLNEGL